MKDYNEMAKAVFERRDEFVARRKKQRAVLLKTGVPLCTLLLVVLISFTLRFDKFPELPVAPATPTTSTHEDTPDYGEDASSQSFDTDENSQPTQGTLPPDSTEPQAQKPSEDSPENSADSVKPPSFPVVVPTEPQPTKPPQEGEYPHPSTDPTVPIGLTDPTAPMPLFLEVNGDDSYGIFDEGTIINYTVELEADRVLENVSFAVSYDPSKLRLIPGSVTANNLSGVAVRENHSHGVVSLSAADHKGSFDFRREKVLVNLDFEVVGTGTSKIDFGVENMIIYQGEGVFAQDVIGYFLDGNQIIFKGIGFEHKLSLK